MNHFELKEDDIINKEFHSMHFGDSIVQIGHSFSHIVKVKVSNT